MHMIISNDLCVYNVYVCGYLIYLCIGLYINICTRTYTVKVAGDVRCYLLPKFNLVVHQLVISRAKFTHNLFAFNLY